MICFGKRPRTDSKEPKDAPLIETDQSRRSIALDGSFAQSVEDLSDHTRMMDKMNSSVPRNESKKCILV
jgi:hypothetical protein